MICSFLVEDAFGTQLKAMDVDSYEESDSVWWGGNGVWSGDEAALREHGGGGEVYQMQNYWGKGPRQDIAFKGKGYAKGDKGGGKKGFGKGFGKDKGKGKGGGFQGYCHWCGEWGHSQARCRQKDEYMEGMRRSKGSEKGGHDKGGYPTAHNVEEDVAPTCAHRDLEMLERTGWRTLCYLEENRFGPLAEDEVSEVDEAEGPPGLEWNTVAVRKRPHKQKNMEVSAVYKKESSIQDSQGDLWITIDSGASENVISEKMAPQFEVKPSQGSREGVRYVTANGETMANRGEKDVKVMTHEGHRCLLKMQVTDVKKPLMSVARICDAGHRVVFTKDGGSIEHEVTGQTTKFDRIDNVYRLQVGLADDKPVFSRQGR